MGRSFFYRYACSLLAYNSHAGRRIACGIMTGSLLMGLYPRSDQSHKQGIVYL